MATLGLGVKSRTLIGKPLNLPGPPGVEEGSFPQTKIRLPFFNYLFLCLFLVALGLGCCSQSFSSCGEMGLLFVALHRLPIAGLSCCEAQAQ